MKFNVLCLPVYFKDFKRDAKRARFVNSDGRTKLHKIIRCRKTGCNLFLLRSKL